MWAQLRSTWEWADTSLECATRRSWTPQGLTLRHRLSGLFPAPCCSDGPGVRIMASSGSSMMLGMSAAAGAGVGSVRFMSNMGVRRAADPLLAEAIAKYF